MNRIERLAKAREFAACYAQGRVHKGRYVVVHDRGNDMEYSRVGFSVSKKLGKAVKRNRVKRRLREIVRALTDRIVTGHDIVIAARVVSADAPYEVLNAGVLEVLRRAGVLLPAGAGVNPGTGGTRAEGSPEQA